MRRNHSYYVFAPHICGVVLRAYLVRGKSHIQRNASGEVATTLPPFYNEPHRSHAVFVKAEPGMTFISWSQHHFVGTGKARAACAQSFALWQQATILIMRRNHSVIACSRHIYVVLFFTHIPFVVNHTFNANGEVATVLTRLMCVTVSIFKVFWEKTVCQIFPAFSQNTVEPLLYGQYQNTIKLYFLTLSVFRWNSCSLKCFNGHGGQILNKTGYSNCKCQVKMEKKHDWTLVVTSFPRNSAHYKKAKKNDTVSSLENSACTSCQFNNE